MNAIAQALISVDELLRTHNELHTSVRASQRRHKRMIADVPDIPSPLLSLPALPSPSRSRSNSPSSASSPVSPTRSPTREINENLNPEKRARAARYVNYVPEEETIRNDYSQRYVDGGEWPQNWVLGADPDKRFEEYASFCDLIEVRFDEA